MVIKTEKELASKVVEWLSIQHWDVYQEVQFRRGGSIADIVAVRNNYIWIIECKKSFSLDVMEQASNWRSHFRSAAVQALISSSSTNRDRRYKLAKEYFKIGTLVVSNLNVIERVPSPLMREYHRFAKTMMKNLHIEQKSGEYASAGSDVGGYFTPYKNTMGIIKNYIGNNPGCTLKEIINCVGNKSHYYSISSAKGCIRLALSRWESNWCRSVIENGKFRYYIR